MSADPSRLLKSVAELTKRQEELARLRGENFNVFQVLDLENKEEQLHSRFLGELLNPEGSHGLGDIFLRLFLKHVGQADWLRSEEAVLEREKGIGSIRMAGEDSEGGRIDIFIKDRKRHLSIEDKIWSVEGEKQITRYCNFESDRNRVLFLTLDGADADTEKTNYEPISYSEHIRPWLESCQRESADFPVLRETIKQYLITVKRLTGGLNMDNDDLMNLMRGEHSAARAIRDNYDRLVCREIGCLRKDVKERMKGLSPIREDLGVWQFTNEGNLDSKWAGLHVNHRHNWGKTSVGWQGNPWIAKKPIYGVVHKLGDRGREERESWKAELSEIMGPQPAKGDTWPCYAHFSLARFSTESEVAVLLDPESRSRLAQEIAEKLMELVRFCHKRLGGEDSECGIKQSSG